MWVLMCAILWDMRLHVYLEDELVGELDQLVGTRERSAFIGEAVRDALDRKRRWDKIWSAVGSISDEGHVWDADPAAWVRSQRRQQTKHSDSRTTPPR
jgi:hypothetical protein